MEKDEIFEKYKYFLSKGNKEETEKWILSLTDEEFDMLTSFPFIVQAKIHYKKLRDSMK